MTKEKDKNCNRNMSQSTEGQSGAKNLIPKGRFDYQYLLLLTSLRVCEISIFPTSLCLTVEKHIVKQSEKIELKLKTH